MRITHKNIFFAFLFIACNNPYKNKANSLQSDAPKPKLIETIKVNKLPAELNEISGITFINDSIVASIQDEDGMLYYYNINQNKIEKKQPFGEPNDYEDLVRVGKDMYVMSSKGTIYQIKNFASEKPVVTPFKTPLKGKNNIEGLAYDEKNNRLLLAAKDYGLDKDETTKEIYSVDLKTMQFQPAPTYVINTGEIKKYFKGDTLEESSKKFLKALGNENMNKVFRSSALTINPATQEVYVLSSINNLIAVLSPKGKIKRLLEFPKKDFQQPEGIAFSPNGKLYISNEARGGIPNIIEVKDAE